MNSFWCNFLPIVVGIGSALLGGLIGWYFRRPRIKELEDIVDEKNADYMHVKNAHEMLDIRYNNLQKEHVSLSVSHNTLTEKKNIIEKEYANLSASHNTLNDKVGALENEHSSLSVSYNTFQEKIQELEEERTALSASHNTSQEKIQELEEDLAALENAKTVVTKHFVNYRTTAENRIEELEHSTEEWKKKHSFLLTRYDSQNSRIIELENLTHQREDDFSELNTEKKQSANRIAELLELKNEWESSYRTLFNQQKISEAQIAELEQSNLIIKNQLNSKEQLLAELQDANQQKTFDFEELANEQSILKSQIETLQQTLSSIEETSESQYSRSDSRVKLYEKELIELQDAKAQLEITRIKLENELDILRGHHTEVLTQNNELTELGKAGRMRLDYLEQQNFETRIAALEAELEIFRNKEEHPEIKVSENGQVLNTVILETPVEVETEEVEESIVEMPIEIETQEVVESIAETPVEVETEEVEESIAATPNEIESAELENPIEAISISPDDLKVVEGIGPKIEAVLHDAGILTFEQLAKTDPERINAILDAAGPRYRIHNPSTWPTQAELAAKNDWDKLKELKEHLLGGRDRATN